MKPEFSQILIPNGKLRTDSSESIIEHKIVSTSSVNSTIIKWLLVTTLLFTFILTILTTGFIVRFEDKLTQYEERIFSLENELDKFIEKLIPADEEFEYETHSNHGNLFDESDEDAFIEVLEEENDSQHEPEEPFGEVKLQEKEERSQRSKRQIPLSIIPTYGPEIERSEDGVPIIDRSYLSSAGVTLRPRLLSSVPATDSEGLRLYEGLVETGGRNEPKSFDFAQREGLRPLLPHHQVSAAWSERTEQRRPRLELKSGDSFGIHATSGPQFSEDLTYTRSNTRRSSSSYSSQSGTSGTGSSSNYQTGGNVLVTPGGSSPGATYHRNSRVPSTGDYLYPSMATKTTTQTRSVQYPPLRTLSTGEGEVIARVLQSENEADSDRPNKATASANYGQTANAEASSTRHRTGGYRRHRQNQQVVYPGVTSSSQSYSSRRDGQKYHRKSDASDEDSGEISVVKAEAWVEGPKPIAAHYVADVSNYTTAHKNYDGNGRLRNADGIFASWRPSEWMTADSGDGTKNFVLSPTGVLTVKKTGLYYIYAQIHYLDEHDINGFTVQVNTDPFLQCTTMTETYNAGSKSNSCFTAGVTYLKENDRIVIKDIETNRYSIFKPEKSFFGLMKMGDSNR